MQLADFSLVEEVHFQPRLLRFVTLDGKVYPPDIILEMLNILPAPRWSLTNAPVWDYLVSLQVIVFDNDNVAPGPAFDEFKEKLERFAADHPSKPLKWQSVAPDKFAATFDKKKVSTVLPDQMPLFD
jgi:hypothetical protein